ncbi:MAG TPA: RNHCP domain-containing protein [Thermomicrobiales bacterium]|nr:RNHCP domain-containing protein [Thermomicrobiales bacterium]
MASHATSAYLVYETDDPDDEIARPALRKANRARRRAGASRPAPRPPARPRERGGPTRAARAGAETFRCRRCRALVGPTLTGGRHRNHCPLCLHSRHVDDKRPGDRASACRALMAPVARFDRPDGEVMVVHRCLGCGVERHNRLAADDSVVALARLPLVAPPARAHRDEAADERRAS